MELYAQVLNYAIPFFVILILIEYVIGRRMQKQTIYAYDTISSLSSGVTNSIKDVLGLTVIILSYHWMYEHIALYHMETQWWMFLLAFIGLDFAGYWSHRFEHVVNLFWNRHIIHHSSEEFNLSCALRQSVSTVFGIFFFLMIPTALMGVPPAVVAIVAPLHLFAQFWYHTTLIDKMGVLEHVIVTPSHHRVHHAINEEYLDKNFGQIFILWDKWFGTFQEELSDVAPVYGVKRPVQTWNPLLINVQHFWLLLTDSIKTRHWRDKLAVWFKPTGWRPEDRLSEAPISTIDNVYKQDKYKSLSWPLKVYWSWFQLIMTLLITTYLFNTIADHSMDQLLNYGLWLMVSIFAYTSLMDHSKLALTEVLKFLFGFGLIYFYQGWFGIDQYIPIGTLLMAGYLVLSLMMTLYILYRPPATAILSA